MQISATQQVGQESGRLCFQENVVCLTTYLFEFLMININLLPWLVDH